MGQNVSVAAPTTPLTSNKILVIGKGFYGLTVPKLDPNSVSYRYKIKLNLQLKDKNFEDIKLDNSNPQFVFPIVKGSHNFDNFHFHLPNSDILHGFSVLATLIREEDAALANKKPLVQTIRPKEPQQTSYLNSIMSMVGVKDVFNEEEIGIGFVDLDLLKETDYYHHLTLPLLGKNKEVIAKIDLSVVKPGLTTEIMELKNAVIDNNLTPKSLHSHTFDVIIGEASKALDLRLAKMKVEKIARSWINVHAQERIQVSTIDTCFIDSTSLRVQMFSTTVWYTFTESFIQEAHKLVEERKKKEEERLQKEAEERKIAEEKRKKRVSFEDENKEKKTEIKPTEEEQIEIKE